MSAESNRPEPSMIVSTMSTMSTMTPKKSENQRPHKKTIDPTVRSLLLPVAMPVVTSRAVVAAMLISRPA